MFENKLDVVKQVVAETGDLIIRDPHAFTNAVAYVLWLGDKNWGHNIKRGHQGLSEDALFYINPSLPTGGHIVDIIGSAGSPNAHPVWIDQTQVTAAKGEIGAWSEPHPYKINPSPTPTPIPSPPSPTCNCTPCTCTCGFQDDAVKALAVRVENLAIQFDLHIQDILQRLDRNFNKPTSGGGCVFRR